jgi:glycosyltransferase involved in cell wall biosynthesis
LEKYPENIVYIKQENGGVSSARNNGINYIEGKYVNFLDSDDKWPEDAFSKVWNFFEKNKSKIDVVACRLKYFEAASGYGHPLNFKFNKDRIVCIEYDYSHIQMHMSSCFMKSTGLSPSQYRDKFAD